MPTKRLPENPSLDHLKHQAKDLLTRHSQRDLATAQRIREFHPDFRDATDKQIFATRLSLSDAQLAIAREYGFASWTRLKRHIEKPDSRDALAHPHHQRIEDPLFRHAVDLIDSGDTSGLSLLLKKNPSLIRQRVLFEGENYFRNPTLLEFIAENPVRRGVLPANVVEVATIILNAGPEQSARDSALQLVGTGRVPRECKVQIPLIETLCIYGADPNAALQPAILHGELDAAHALIRLGATPDLPVLAALGRTDEFLALLPASSASQRHLAMALAAQYGNADALRALLDRGEDPNRYNPPGAHSHSTPLHQAALAGRLSVVQLLVERGANLDIKDLLWEAIPADWAHHANKRKIESYLRKQRR
ncbi:MAG: ankyrin repeat domain-containing protein [Silvibacterium sp.]|nr:ankyrin repeat domain-containing protein [Silvibacterium sp.]